MPIIGTDNGGMPEYLGVEERGLICSAGNSDQLCQAILTLVHDRKLRERLGLNARAFVSKHCEHLLVAKKSISAYKDCVERHGQSVSQKKGIAAHSLKRLIHDAYQMCELLEKYLEKYGPASMEILGYNKGYQSGLIDGESAGFQKGKKEVIYSNIAITTLYRLQSLWQTKD